MSVNVSVASSLEEIWEKLFAFFPSTENSALTKDSFGNKKQHIGESVDQFANELQVLSFKTFPANTLQERESFILQRFANGIGNVKTREKFIRKELRSMEEALSTARDYVAAANAMESSLDNTLGAMAINVAESKLAYDVSDNHGWSSKCIYCQRFGSAAQRCGHNPLLDFRDPVDTGRVLDKKNRGFTAPRGRSHGNVLFLPSVSYQNSHSLLFCSVGLNGCSALTMLNTGAACTVVRSLFCPEVRPYQRELRTANGTVLQTKGSSRINMTIGNKTVPQEACFSDAIPWDGIIGLDLLVRAECTIDLQ
ncbi:hypothetical protein EG68_12492 [Paragonimus skrjabini miyazakii]|uniref:Peptidase A2 domain-containing protein n=1 Tax=Paragonimus skrjabini miyazakii TaxID=59628 RepID=A0A8S9YJ91_9TREM|nr:hypothetical protein EG68_12492 [Paragonimus skrjabini miyazakii]